MPAVVAISLLLLAVGPAYGQKAPKVSGADILDGSITSADVADGSLAGADIASNSLTGNEINESTLMGVDADTLDGVDSTEFARGQGRAFLKLLCPNCGAYPSTAIVGFANWQFSVELACTLDDGKLRARATLLGPSYSSSAGESVQTADSGQVGYLTMVAHAEGSPVLINGVPTPSIARVEVLGRLASEGVCVFTGVVQEARF
jgi:hypothetical protein